MSARERQRQTPTAFDLACRWLGRAPRSQAEVRARLTGLGFSDSTVDQTLRRLRELQFVDDNELARTRAQALAVRGYGDAWVERDLKERGLADDAVENALAGLAPESTRASEWVERRLRGRARQTAWRSLLQRGFRPESADCAVGAAGGENGPGFPD